MPALLFRRKRVINVRRQVKRFDSRKGMVAALSND
jgi:hypothetical protein